MNQPSVSGTAPPEIIYIIRHGESQLSCHRPRRERNRANRARPSESTRRATRIRTPCCRGGGSVPALSPSFSILVPGRRQRGWKLRQPCSRPSTVIRARRPSTGLIRQSRALVIAWGCRLSPPSAISRVPDLAASVVSNCSGVVLICWEHHNIPAIASSLPTAPGTVIPQTWPDDRFDVVWTFTLVPPEPPRSNTPSTKYRNNCCPEMATRLLRRN